MSEDPDFILISQAPSSTRETIELNFVWRCRFNFVVLLGIVVKSSKTLIEEAESLAISFIISFLLVAYFLLISKAILVTSSRFDR
jgi:hypothetical protein